MDRRPATWPFLALLVTLLGTTSAQARVLTAAAADEITSSFKRAQPGWTHRDVSINQEQVATQFCRTATGRCYPVRLTDPTSSCSGEKAGPWCVAWTDERPPAVEAQELLAVLASARESLLWSGSATPVTKRPDDGGGNDLAMGLLLLAGSLMSGWLLGLALHLRERGRLRLLLAVATPIVSMSLFPSVEVGVLDLLTIGLLASLGMLLASRPRQVLFMVATLSIGLVGLECAVRVLLSPPTLPALQRGLRFPHAAGSSNTPSACRALGFHENADWIAWRRDGPPPPGPSVVHLGDSMIYGQGCGNSATATAALERLDPGYAHINLGMPGTSLDAQYQLWRNLRDALRPVGVVVHVYLGNDFLEMDQPFPCCEEGALLDYADGVPRSRCAQLRWKTSIPTLLDHSPATLLQRGLAPFSRVAAYSVVPTQNALHELATRFKGRPLVSRELGWQHWEIVLRALRNELAERKIRLVLSVLPTRRALAGDADGSAADKVRVLEVAARLGVPVLDPEPALREIIQGGEGNVFLRDPPGEIHFAEVGNEVYGRWLAGQLGPGMAKTPIASAVDAR